MISSLLAEAYNFYINYSLIYSYWFIAMHLAIAWSCYNDLMHTLASYSSLELAIQLATWLQLSI